MQRFFVAAEFPVAYTCALEINFIPSFFSTIGEKIARPIATKLGVFVPG
jgi:hypothetical protein